MTKVADSYNSYIVEQAMSELLAHFGGIKVRVIWRTYETNCFSRQ